MINKLPEGVYINKVSFKLTQDDHDFPNDEVQEIDVKFECNGAGFFPVLSSEKWAYDEGELILINNYINELLDIVNKDNMFNKECCDDE